MRNFWLIMLLIVLIAALMIAAGKLWDRYRNKPLKPIKKAEYYYENGILKKSAPEYICRNCGVAYVERSYSRCPLCHRRIDWRSRR